jgi:hypothetical protein
MATKDGLPLGPSDHRERSEQSDTGAAWDDPVISPWILKVSILGLTAAAIFFAIVAMEDPRVLIAKTTAFLTASRAPQDDTREATPIVQSTAEAPALPPTASEASGREEIAAPFKAADQGQAADQSQTEIPQTPTATLLAQFQAWAASKDAPAETPPAQPLAIQPVPDAQADPVQDARAQPAQDVQARPVQNARAEIRHAREHRSIRRAKIARAEIRPRAEIRAKPHHRVKLRREQDARAQDARVQVRPAQYYYYRAQEERPVEAPQAQAPSFLESLGLSRSN